MPRLASREHWHRGLDAAEGADAGQDQPGHRHRLHRQPLRQVDTKLLRARQRECKPNVLCIFAIQCWNSYIKHGAFH